MLSWGINSLDAIKLELAGAERDGRDHTHAYSLLCMRRIVDVVEAAMTHLHISSLEQY